MLYLLGTPIGNLEDISERALRILSEVDAIGAEDTRHTRKLLSYFDIHTSTFSFHQHNELTKTEVVIDRLKAGEDIAIVSDAGMPLISDAGQLLVERVQAENLKYTVIPGPTAIDTALVLSGFSTNKFQFLGFAPRDTKDKKALVDGLSKCPMTTILYESPKRVLDTITFLGQQLPGRKFVLARELTKVYEEVIKGTSSEIVQQFAERELKGECVILVEGINVTAEIYDFKKACDLVEKIQQMGSISHSNAAKIVAEISGIPRRKLYKASLED